MSEGVRELRVLVANEDQAELDAIAAAAEELGHRVIATVLEIGNVGAVTTQEEPDVALVGLGPNTGHALGLIDQIVAQAECPVIVLLPGPDSAFVSQAARRGIFAYIDDARLESLRSSLELALLRFADYHGLEGAFGRRAIIEQAKGIMMERHGLDPTDAFETIRHYARNNNMKLVDVARDVAEGQLSLSP